MTTAPRRSRGSDIRAIAHELGQPLSAILTSAQAARGLLATEIPKVAEARLALDEIIAQGRRVAAIFRQLEARLTQMEDKSGE